MSTIKVNTIQDTSGNTQYMAKAWVNFNGTGTVSIRASGNVSSVTDRGTGLYTVNFVNALADNDYTMAGSGAYPTSLYAMPRMDYAYSEPFTTSSAYIRATNFQWSTIDASFLTVTFFR
jgi:hypothetical protein